jgi:hypothetical protein
VGCASGGESHGCLLGVSFFLNFEWFLPFVFQKRTDHIVVSNFAHSLRLPQFLTEHLACLGLAFPLSQPI